MKNILSILMLVFLSLQLTYAKDVITQDEKRLPENARNFIEKYFPDIQVSYIKIDKEMLEPSKYKVLMTDRKEFEFDKNGNWTEIDCKNEAVPPALIPKNITSYVKQHFPKEIIIQIERKRRYTEVELSNDLSLKFNKNGRLIEIDD